MIKFKAHETTESGEFIIELLEGDYAGSKFTLGGVSFAEKENDDGTIDLGFDLHTINCDVSDGLKQVVGDLVLQILEEQVKNGEVVYRGGSDEVAS